MTGPRVQLVVGAGGYLGSEIVRQARATGLPVRALVRDEAAFRALVPDPEVQVVVGDLADRRLLRRLLSGVAVAHHVALDPASRARRRNREALRALVDACARADVHLLYASCAMVYAPAPGRLPEDAPLRSGAGGPARQHRPAEVEIAAAAHERDLRATRLRLAPLLGSGQAPGARGLLVAAIAAGKPFLDPFPAHRLLGYLDRRDAARCFLLAAEQEMAYGQVVNVAGPEPLPRVDFLRALAAAAGRPLRRREVPAAVLRAAGRLSYHARDLLSLAEGDLVLDGERARALVGYTPYYTLADSVETALRAHQSTAAGACNGGAGRG